MVNLNSFLNKKNSLRNISDDYFNSIVEELAELLSSVSVESNYTDEQLLKDWNSLLGWKTQEENINSTSRLGMKLCEHFFPNFYDIEDNKGKSFRNQWTKENLIKILRWNRKSHSTPYLSELKRGIYFCCGMTKNTMYRPQMAKMICDRYNPKMVLDPCAGWGGRMLGCVASGAYYIAFEPNTETFNNLQRLIGFLGIQDKVRIICDDALNMDKYDLPNFDLILTSPPYFDLEVYTHEDTQSIKIHNSYESWSENFLRNLIHKSLSLLNDGGVSCWNVGKVGKNDMNDDVLLYHQERDFMKFTEFSVVSSKRQSNQSTKKNEKNSDKTIIYKKT